MLKINDKEFRENLLLTRHYCEQQLTHKDKNYASILRSINPRYGDELLFRYTFYEYSFRKEYHLCSIVEWSREPFQYGFFKRLFERQLMFKKHAVSTIDSSSIPGGAIVVVQTDETVVDGASAIASAGLFDNYDYPPIDTWFYLTQNAEGTLLFAWIPESFVRLSGQAIAVNCVNCIHWFKEIYPEEYSRYYISAQLL